MNQYRMQNRYTNHLPGHFYCRHGIDLNLSCSLCATPASLIASGDDGEGGQVLQLERRKELRQTRPVSTGDDAGRSDEINERIEQFRLDHELAMQIAIFGRSDAGDAAKGSK